MARPAGSPNKDKPYRDALRMAIAEAGEDHKALRRVANAHLAMCYGGDMTAIKELADRLDGKVPQAHTGADDGPLLIEALVRTIVDPKKGE